MYQRLLVGTEKRPSYQCSTIDGSTQSVEVLVHQIQGQAVRLITEYVTTVVYIRNQGGTKSFLMLGVT